MTSFSVLSNSPVFRDILDHTCKFLGRDDQISYEPIPDSVPYISQDIIFSGHEHNPLNVKETLRKIRRQNPYTPVIILSSGLDNLSPDEFQNQAPVYFCKWPFSSYDFVCQIITAEKESVASQKACQILEKIEAAIEKKEPDNAIALLQQLSGHIPEYQRLILSARCLLGSDKLQEALADAKKAMNLEPDHAEAIEIHAVILNAMGQRNRSLELLDKKKEITSKDSKLMLLQADLNLQSNLLADAKECFRLAAQLDPSSKEARQGKFLVGVMDGSVTGIKSDKDKTKTSLELATMCNNKAIALVRAKEYEVAENLYQSTIRIMPDKRVEYKLWMNLGLCMKKAKNWAKALEYFQTGKQKAPESYGRFDEQIKNMQRIIRLNKS